MHLDEYRKLVETEDRMWYFRSLHAHARRELEAGLARPAENGRKNDAADGPVILDAGCGTGGLILRLRGAHPHWKVKGIDFMPLACELARSRCGPETEIREASITALPFAGNSFDAVVSVDVICQIENPEAAMAEFHRVLRPGGLLVINVPAYQWMWSYHDTTVHTKHRYDRPEVDALLRNAGFEQRRLTHWNSLTFPLIWAKRKLFHTRHDTSDVKLYPAPIEWFFNGVMSAEHAWLRAGGRWAWGNSVLAVARRA